MLIPRAQAERLPPRQREVWHRLTREEVTPSRVGTYPPATAGWRGRRARSPTSADRTHNGTPTWEDRAGIAEQSSPTETGHAQRDLTPADSSAIRSRIRPG